MRALKIHAHGPISDLKVSETERPKPGPGEILVRIEAAAINPSDSISAEGKFPEAPLPRILGRDFAGEVVEGAEEHLGKRVWGAGGDLGITRDGTHAEYVVLPGTAVAERPKNLSAAQAASVGVPYQTAWSAVVTKGGLREGEVVIVSGAAGAVGGASVQIAYALGAKVIALLKDEGEDVRLDSGKVVAVAYSAANNLVDVVRKATDGRGADLAINAVGGAIFQPMSDALATFGRMVIFSAVGGREVNFNIFDFYRRDLTFHGLNTAHLDVSGGAAIMRKLTPLFETGKLASPSVKAEYPFDRAAEAYAASANGKVVLVP